MEESAEIAAKKGDFPAEYTLPDFFARLMRQMNNKGIQK